MADDSDIRAHISELVDEEKELRAKLSSGEISRDEEQARLLRVEAELDQAWDLLRQRDARREFGDDPNAARVRPQDVVENYEG